MGCFPKHTRVKTPEGFNTVQNIHVGDNLLRPHGNKELVSTPVRKIFESESELLTVISTHGTIVTTPDQLFFCYDGNSREARDLTDQFVGYWLPDAEELVYIHVSAIIPKNKKEKVFHFHVEEPNLYLVEDASGVGFYVVHNKGGGGGGSSSSTTSASIAPELQPLFKQTGGLLQELQTFQPRFVTNPFANFSDFSFGSTPTARPMINMTQTAPGSFVPMPASGSNYVTDAAQQISSGNPASRYQEALASQDPAAERAFIGLQLSNRPEGAAVSEAVYQQRLKELDSLTASPSGGGGGFSSTSSPAGPAGLPGSILDEFLFPAPQFIPQATTGQQAILQRQRERAFGPQITPQELISQAIFRNLGQMRPGEEFATGITSTLPFLRPEETRAIDLGTRFGQLRAPESGALGLASGFGELRLPEELALLQANELTGGPLGSSPATQAAIQAATEPILNRLAEAGLGRSGAIGTELGGAFAPILAQEMALRAQVIPQLAGIGQAQRGGDIAAGRVFQQAGEAMRTGDITQATQLTNIAQAARSGSVQAAQIQLAIANAQRAGDDEGARRLAEIGDTLVKRESTLLGEAGASEEIVRQLQAQQAEAITNDLLRRQAIASNLTTGILSGFPAVGGQTTVTKTKAPGGGMTVICSELYRQGLLDEDTYQADAEFGRSLSQEVLLGYQIWAIPIVHRMSRSKLLTAFIALFALPWSREMRKRVKGCGQGSWLGRTMLFIGIPICRQIGRKLNKKILRESWG